MNPRRLPVLSGLTSCLALLILACSVQAQAFQPPIHIADASLHYPNQVELVDLDQDGDQDLLGIALNHIVWYANDGSGGFGPEQLIDNSLSPRGHHLADLNGDGLKDLLISERDFDAIQLMLGNGSSFDPPTLLHTVDGPLGLDAADLNGDGFLDLLYGSYKEVAWLAGDGLGGFGPVHIVQSATFTEHYADVAAGDWDGDGDTDVAYAWESGSKVVWHDNTGSAVFGPQQFMPSGLNGVATLEVADVNLDSLPDIYGASAYYGARVGYYRNFGFGAFFYRANIGASIDGPEGLCLGDITGNGYPDAVVVSYYDKEVMYFENTDGFYGDKVRVLKNTTDNFVDAVLGDVDGDGFADLVVASVSPTVAHQYRWFRNSQGGCSTRQAPNGLSSVQLPSSVRLQWNAIDQSLGCQINATRTSPPGFSTTRAYLGAELDQVNVSNAVLGPGTHWDWSVRCACSTVPLEATPYSATASFSVPTPREQEPHAQEAAEQAILVYPNPASDRIRLEGEGQLNIVNMLGQRMYTGRINGVQELQLGDWPEGIYLVELEGKQQQLLIQH